MQRPAKPWTPVRFRPPPPELPSVPTVRFRWNRVKVRVAAKKLAGADEIGLAVGKIVNQYKVAKHFELAVSTLSFTFERKRASISAEAALDGI